MGRVKLPLTQEEIAALTEIAQRLDEKTGGFEGRSYLQSLLWFLKTGMHPQCLTANWQPVARIIEEGGAKYVMWRRTKKKDIRGITKLVLSKDIESFAIEFIQNLPIRRQFWNELFIRLEQAALAKYPHHIGIAGLCPLQLRHTCAVELLRKGVHAEIIRQALNVSPQTLAYYVKMVPEMLAKEMQNVNW